jgi:hypothetical protein
MLQAWAIEDTSTGYLTFEIHTMPNNAKCMGDRGYRKDTSYDMNA